VSDVSEITREVEVAHGFLGRVRRELSQVIVGQDALINGLLVGLLADGHILLEGVPGLAKTLAARSLAAVFEGSYARIQFTPDLLPSDLLGTHIWQPASATWSVREGPIFAHFVLADEINRAPAKVQSALLEAMQERQVSLAGDTRALPQPFMVLATQNPVDQEGTYPLPEAQVDRFMLKLLVSYPTPSEEKDIITRMATAQQRPSVRAQARLEDLLSARRIMDKIHVAEKILDYVVDLVFTTREPARHGLSDLAPSIRYGASPRASLALVQSGRARAFMAGRGFVTPDDIKAVAHDVLRHRVIPSWEAEAEGISPDDLIRRILATVPVP
jgi:MoxR-like ATPase